ncbi:hypothetical protein AB0A05_27385 [Streptomyces sp. NPDC046374]|uniref:hypothetical protein n=1 Tax=Streptomyces sp. NPDC046374 TaxID=3154917 RepID=UPI0033C5BA4A
MTTPATYVPRHQVPAPVIAPRRYTLIGSIPEVPGDAEGTWQRGVEYYSEGCNLKTGYIDGWCPPTDDEGNEIPWDKEITPFEPARVASPPFTINSGVDCRSPVFPSDEKARAALARGEDLQVERRFWAQQMARPDLVKLPTTDPTKVLDLVAALAAIEDEASQRYSGLPWIFVSPGAFTFLKERRVIERDSNLWRTALDSIVVPGAGFVGGKGPAAADPPAAGFWILATGQPVMRRSEVFAHEAFDYSTNRRGAIAERTYTITADCLALAIQAAPCACTPTTTPASGLAAEGEE